MNPKELHASIAYLLSGEHPEAAESTELDASLPIELIHDITDLRFDPLSLHYSIDQLIVVNGRLIIKLKEEEPPE